MNLIPGQVIIHTSAMLRIVLQDGILGLAYDIEIDATVVLRTLTLQQCNQIYRMTFSPLSFPD